MFRSSDGGVELVLCAFTTRRATGKSKNANTNKIRYRVSSHPLYQSI